MADSIAHHVRYRTYCGEFAVALKTSIQMSWFYCLKKIQSSTPPSVSPPSLAALATGSQKGAAPGPLVVGRAGATSAREQRVVRCCAGCLRA